ncbi:MAG: hypothetical protein IT173_11300 [Acidobacteria bacterium]|nr:hypothetical protein [Acidobacteriota bacterium]
MDEAVSKYEVTGRDLARGRNLKIAAWTAPILIPAVPAVLFTVLALVLGTTPPLAFTLFVVGMILAGIGMVIGLSLMTFFIYRRSAWTQEMREKMAADGIRAEEIDWFRHELRASEKRALKDISKADLLLADAYRETLASRLTATRIVKSSRKELASTQRRRSKLKQFRSERAAEFGAQLEKDSAKIGSIHDEAKLMLAESEARLQMIEAAAARGRGMADSELALKKLSTRSENLPLALEEMRRTEEIAREIERDLEKAERPASELSNKAPDKPI